MGRTLIAAAPAMRQPSLPGAHRTVAPPIVRPAAAVDAGARHLVAKRGRLEGQREGRLSPLRIRLLHEDVETADAGWLAIGGGVATACGCVRRVPDPRPLFLGHRRAAHGAFHLRLEAVGVEGVGVRSRA